MRRIVRTTAPACAAAVVLLSGCTGDGGGDAHSDRPPATHGATATAAPDEAVERAGRYRRSGGLEDVYAIRRTPGSDGAPLLVVWTHDPDESPETLDALKESVTGFLHREEGLSLDHGYLMDVFGPDGSLLHRLDARP